MSVNDQRFRVTWSATVLVKSPVRGDRAAATAGHHQNTSTTPGLKMVITRTPPHPAGLQMGGTTDRS
ncbi:unnamed protein product [Boreogadus saida]